MTRLSQGGISANNSSVGGSSQFISANAAGATSQGTTAGDQEVKKAAATGTGLGGGTDEDEKKKRAGAGGPMLARRVGRVTVILPKG